MFIVINTGPLLLNKIVKKSVFNVQKKAVKLLTAYNDGLYSFFDRFILTLMWCIHRFPTRARPVELNFLVDPNFFVG